MDPDKDFLRYVEYLQRTLSGTIEDKFIQDEQNWFHSNKTQIIKKYKNLVMEFDIKTSVGFDFLEENIINFSESTSYDTFFSKHIFTPVLKDVEEIAKMTDLKVKGPIVFANSPGIGPVTYARPSGIGHIIFAGRGTSAFCNYWSKIIIEIIDELKNIKRNDITHLFIADVIEKNKIGSKIQKLIINYALLGTVIGYGKYEHSKELMIPRGLLVHAMEVFIIAHEYGHFLAEEHSTNSGEVFTEEYLKEVEIFCDRIGLSICTGYGAEKNNNFAFEFVAPILFFYTVYISESIKSFLFDEETRYSSSHPSIEIRIENIFTFAHEVKASDSVLGSMNLFLGIAKGIEEYVIRVNSANKGIFRFLKA